MKTAYIVWSLLPALFAIITVWVIIKKKAKLPGKEHVRDSLNQAIFCSFALLIAIGIDNYFFDGISEYLAFDESESGVFRYLIYPGVLVSLAVIQSGFDEKPKTRVKHVGYN